MIIKGEIEKIIYSNETFFIFTLNNGTKAKFCGTPDIDIKKEIFVELEGEFELEGKYGQTFVCDNIKEISQEETFELLSLAIDGIGEKKALEILNDVGSYSVFKDEPFKIFDYFLSKPSKSILEQIREKRHLFTSNEKEIVAKQMNKEIKGVGTKKILSWMNTFEETYPYDTQLFLEDDSIIYFLASDTALKVYEQIKHIDKLEKDYKFLIDLKLPQYCINYLFKDFKFESLKTIKGNPYVLLNYGISFPSVDNIAIKTFEIEKESKTRIINGILYVIKLGEKEGNTFVNKKECLKQTANLLEVDYELVEKECDNEILKPIEPEFIQKDEKLYRRVIFFTERKLGILIGNKAKENNNEVPKYISDYLKTTTLSEKQQAAVIGVLSKKISILTGGPGTGKTTTINEVCNCLDKLGKKYFLAAPTGRAAKRITESTGREAKTLHRLLEYKPRGIFGSFSRNEHFPLWTDYVIVDESSMLDVYMLNNLIKAVKTGTSIVFVGDINQLPSVSMGSVLMDMKDSKKVEVFELTEVFRQSLESSIIKNAYHIQNNEPLEINNSDFIFKKVSSYNEVKEYLLSLNFDYQILCPMRVGELGTININQLMQEIKNGSESTQFYHSGRLFKVNDKIIQCDNDYNKEVYNGEIGTIIKMDNEHCFVEYINNNPNIIKYKLNELYEIDLSYAISIHKSQGSEADNVVLIVDGNKDFLSKELIYTAVTRAKKKLVLLSTYDLDFYSNLSVSNNRMTNLKNLIV